MCCLRYTEELSVQTGVPSLNSVTGDATAYSLDLEDENPGLIACWPAEGLKWDASVT